VFWLVTDLYTIPQEEKFLSARFQEEWQRYSQQTRRWL
ncbi:isoprenylcysteine carboxylmethyltransferase family protein, partial [Providencia stuartii]